MLIHRVRSAESSVASVNANVGRLAAEMTQRSRSDNWFEWPSEINPRLRWMLNALAAGDLITATIWAQIHLLAGDWFLLE